MVVTKNLDGARHAGLKILTSKADEKDIRQFLMDAKLATEPGDLHNIDAVLQVSVSANNEIYEKVRGDKKMCEALKELMKDEIAEEKSEARYDTKIEDIKNVMKNLKLSAEQAMDAIGISADSRGMYLSRLK